MEEDDSPTLMAYSRRSNRYASRVKEDPEDGFRQSSNPGLNPVQEMEEDNSPSSHIDPSQIPLDSYRFVQPASSTSR
ncbi:hypothetical protein GOP47_0021568 [Adiantum capillus-veneris]|uniref:Uncharacterized protein n=1 Tax=Adiantum capillus-veneris TaxID=13818 RepID=A0A9D4U7P6_ADICA|nr:hypothetical protein GOP47_0021568 [Adiantum capillus-veneris]